MQAVNALIIFFKKNFRPEIVFFLAFLFTGLYIYNDYGLSFDEEVQRTDNGIVNYNRIISGNDTALLQSKEKYHGPAFEIFLVFVERTLHLTDGRSIYLSRHLLTFLLFFTGVIFFYLLSRNYFNSNEAALLSCITLVLSPRIFADSFYNSKDIPFLAVFIISVYFLTWFIKKQNVFFAFMYACVTGILIDIRITGIIIPLLTVLIFLADKSLKYFGRKWIVRSAYLLIYLFLSGIFVVLFWPILWTNPILHFPAALGEMSKFPWFGDVKYMGRIYLANTLPWHYLPVWIFISTPFTYMVLFSMGVFFLTVRLVKSPLKFYENEKESVIFLSWFFVPLLSVILLGSVVYDGWRHLYFIYPAFILLTVKGFYLFIDFFDRKNYQAPKKILKSIVLLTLIYVAAVMIITHPYQNVYFNFFAGNPETKFERDYWGLSFRKGLEHILESDSSDKIMIIGSNSDVKLNMQILPQKDRDRLIYTNYFEFADYYLDNFRWNRDINQPLKEIFSLSPMNVKIMSVYKVQYRKSEKTILMMRNDFEKDYPGWNSCHDTTIGGAAYSGSKVCKIDSSDIDSVGVSLPYDSLSKSGGALAVYVSMQIFELDTGKVPLLVISVSNREEKDSYRTEMKLWT